MYSKVQRLAAGIKWWWLNLNYAFKTTYQNLRVPEVTLTFRMMSHLLERLQSGSFDEISSRGIRIWDMV